MLFCLNYVTKMAKSSGLRRSITTCRRMVEIRKLEVVGILSRKMPKIGFLGLFISYLLPTWTGRNFLQSGYRVSNSRVLQHFSG